MAGREGYGFSIWCVPMNWKELRARYRTRHVPHVTIETLLSETKARARILQYAPEYKIMFEDDVRDLSDITYSEDDDVPAQGFYCSLQGLRLHRGHMTLHYETLLTPAHAIAPVDVLGKVVIADTRSSNPGRWIVDI